MSVRALLAAAALALAAPAFAQTDPGQSASVPSQGPADGQPPSSSPMAQAREQMRKACAVDIKTYCNEGGRVGQCLQQHVDKLSPDCRTQLEEMRSQWRQRRPQ